MMRIDKLLAHAGYGSRKEVKNLLKKGYVTVNDQIIKDGKYQVDETSDQIFCQDERITYEKYVYYMLNKPAGTICEHDAINYPSVYDLIDDPHLLSSVGRLDVDTVGLLILTNDGELIHHLTSPHHHINKRYYVEHKTPIKPQDIIAFKDGIILSDFKAKSATLTIIDEKSAYVDISEGKFHQVKRMFHAIDNEVLYLKRVAMGSVVLDDNLETGESRRLTEAEIDGLRQINMI